MNAKTYLGWVVAAVAGWMGFFPLSMAAATPDTLFRPHGKPILQVFGNFELDATNTDRPLYRFWFGRAHFGYQYQFSEQFSAKVILDAGRPTQISGLQINDSTGRVISGEVLTTEGSYYTMTLKFASLKYTVNEHLSIEAGAILQNHYITQERIWGYRYLAETFQDRYFKVPSADLGAIAFLNILPWLGLDIALTNGEGFRQDQDNNGYVKTAAGIDLKPLKNLLVRFYAASQPHTTNGNTMSQSLYSVFAGYRSKGFRAGAEFSRHTGLPWINGEALGGFSFFGAFVITPKWEALMRFDHISGSNAPAMSTGEAGILGLQYSPVEGVRVSFNYQSFYPGSRIDPRHRFLCSFEYQL